MNKYSTNNRNINGQFLKNCSSYNKRIDISKKPVSFFIDLYINKNKSSYQIAKILSCSVPTVLKYLRKNNIEIKTISEGKTDRPSSKKGIPVSQKQKDIQSLIMKNKFKNGYIHPALGKTSSIETRIKQSIAKGGNGILNKRDRYPVIFYRLKSEIKERDNNICQNCGINNEESIKLYKVGLNIHHIDYNKQNCQESNLITACHSCNTRANTNRKQWKIFYTNIVRSK